MRESGADQRVDVKGAIGPVSWRPFDQVCTDLLVRRTVGEVPSSVRLQRRQWDPLGRPASR